MFKNEIVEKAFYEELVKLAGIPKPTMVGKFKNFIRVIKLYSNSRT